MVNEFTTLGIQPRKQVVRLRGRPVEPGTKTRKETALNSLNWIISSDDNLTPYHYV
jgi:hypothetical protein